MEFACLACKYTSSKKENVVRHINKKTSCGAGIKEIIEIPIEIKCSFCKKEFSTKVNLKNHEKNNCKNKFEILERQLQKEKEKNKNLERRLKESDKIADKTIINNYNNYNTIILVNNYENTSLDKLNDNVINELVTNSESYQIIPRLIKEIHFNPDIPENHNIFMSNRNKNNKHIHVYRNGQWEIDNKESEINNIIYDKETNISDWMAKKGGLYPNALENFNTYLDQKYDKETSKTIKEEIELVLYNNRHMVKQ